MNRAFGLVSGIGFIPIQKFPARSTGGWKTLHRFVLKRSPATNSRSIWVQIRQQQMVQISKVVLEANDNMCLNLKRSSFYEHWLKLAPEAEHCELHQDQQRESRG